MNFKKLGIKSEVKMMNPADIHEDPELTPSRDYRLLYQMSEALAGRIEVFYARVPSILLVPFDLDYRPDLHHVGAIGIQMAYEEALEGKFMRPIVYQRGYWFVSSDDYIPLFAAVRGLPDYMGCFILGRPDHDQVDGLQLVAQEDVRSVFGLA